MQELTAHLIFLITVKNTHKNNTDNWIKETHWSCNVASLQWRGNAISIKM